MTTEPDGQGGLRVRVAGELDMATVQEFEDQLRQAVDSGGVVVIDLADLTFMDSTGLACIITAVERARGTGSVLKLLTPLPPQPLRLLELTGVIDRLSFLSAGPRDHR